MDIEIPKRMVAARSSFDRLLIISGAEHGFCAPGDDLLKSPETARIRESVFREILALVAQGKPSGAFPGWGGA